MMLLLPQLCIYIVTNRYKTMKTSPKCIFTDFALFTNKPKENNELQPITTVSIDHVLPKIDLEVEHVLIGVENRRRFSESKIGVVFA